MDWFVFISDSIVMLPDMKSTFSSSALPKRSHLLWLAWLRAPPTSPPGLLPHHHLPVAGAGAGRTVPPPRPGRRHQSGPQPGPLRRQLLLPPALFPFPSAGSGSFDPALAADPPAFVPSLSGARQRPPGSVGRWSQTAQGRAENARGQKPSPGVPLQRQGVLHYGPLPPSRCLVGAGRRGLPGSARGGSHPRGHRLERPRPTHAIG